MEVVTTSNGVGVYVSVYVCVPVCSKCELHGGETHGVLAPITHRMQDHIKSVVREVVKGVKGDHVCNFNVFFPKTKCIQQLNHVYTRGRFY